MFSRRNIVHAKDVTFLTLAQKNWKRKKLKENGGGAVTYFDASHKNGTIGIFKPVCYPLFGNIFCEENGKQRLFDTKILILKVGSVFSNINNIVILMTQTVLLT